MRRLVWLLLFVMASAMAVESAPELRSAVEQGAQGSRVGKFFWIRPTRDGKSEVPIYETVEGSYDAVYVTRVTRFKVVGYDPAGAGWYQLKFDDGKSGIIPWRVFEDFFGYWGYAQILEEDPAAIQAREDAEKRAEQLATQRAAKRERDAERRRITAAKQQAAKPGVRIGMTSQQVLEDTHWGKPQYVNKTQNAYGITEQWVYRTGNYLYFRNGVLETIQY
ncbi:DUF2845 domain-containing protein [Cupriavidus necator]|uniref:DUF2845 domain-containing protein n=1 Tax=Cupriavidus necator (strain ATCC 17699 / DSM 428 / KCTC 22496 / NCIMB 10442 / H16 / Stanier 337) TaxID=381666 RepID=Q0JYK6_CUPNH|nr:hypothetical protein [Cupriavidus necator]QCC04939.1 hypothetical protein E6A55_31230 [Cupriavidus necator H16]QQB79626.1 hypothetical protein I6H87_30780 [Cupriavidus necator]WKA43869.1 hypothetical protein QWP09_31260 [Cupriavidus necator]CAJ97168.1 Hypothetical protein H16_B2386 [Cupriavidus necator H16]